MFSKQLEQIKDRVKAKENIHTEEATKNAFVLPLIQALGYDIFNPLEVIPEFIADIGRKKGEKVDYCIQKNGSPIMIIECKHWKGDLDLHNTQLQRYFHVTKARFGILTNGISYKFYTDLEAPNIMDTKPFLNFSFDNLKESHIRELAKFQKERFDINNILSSASELKYVQGMKTLLDKELREPTPNFVKHFANKVYSGKLTSKVIEQFSELLKQSITQILNERVNNRLVIAQQKEVEEAQEKEVIQTSSKEDKINTTQEEIEAFLIVKSILRKKITPERIFYRDTQSYFSVLLDDNNRKKICRFFLESKKWYIVLFEENNTEEKKQLDTLDDIYKYSNRLIKTAINYLE